jgi:hypothetical protein
MHYTRFEVALARYDRQDPGHELDRATPQVLHTNRTQAIDEMVDRFRERSAPLPVDARHIGGRLKDGLGEYFRQLLAPQRILERDASGNARAVWREGGHDDHFAHAEVYCSVEDMDALVGQESKSVPFPDGDLTSSARTSE